MKQKKCRVCKEKFPYFNSTQVACSPKCAIELVKLNKSKEYDKKTKELKASIKTKADWLKEAQTANNAYIRERDHDDPCISCGRHHQGQYHAGHYLSRGACPELRFHPLNNHKQCQPCNNHLSGNLVNYRVNLIKKIGLDMVEWLEGPHEPQKLSIEDIKEIKEYYKEQFKLIKE